MATERADEANVLPDRETPRLHRRLETTLRGRVVSVRVGPLVTTVVEKPPDGPRVCYRVRAESGRGLHLSYLGRCIGRDEASVGDSRDYGACVAEK